MATFVASGAAALRLVVQNGPTCRLGVARNYGAVACSVGCSSITGRAHAVLADHPSPTLLTRPARGSMQLLLSRLLRDQPFFIQEHKQLLQVLL